MGFFERLVFPIWAHNTHAVVQRSLTGQSALFSCQEHICEPHSTLALLSLIYSSPAQSNLPDPGPFQSVAVFPWTYDSLNTLWKGSLYSETLLSQWKLVVDEFSDAIAVGAPYKMYIFFTRKNTTPVAVKLPMVCMPLNFHPQS